MEKDFFAVAWSDTKELEKVKTFSQSTFANLKEQINSGTLTVKIPFLEYTTGEPVKKEKIDFHDENILLKALEINPRIKILEKVGASLYFQPFIVKIEGLIYQSMWLPDVIRAERSCLLENELIENPSLIEDANTVLNSKDWQIVKRYKKYEDKIQGYEVLTFSENEEYKKEAENNYPGAVKKIKDYVFAKKPVIRCNYRGHAHYVYFYEEQNEKKI